MPREHRPGRDRLDVKTDAAFVDAVKAGAAKNRVSLSAYILMALAKQLKEDQIDIPLPAKAENSEKPEPELPKRSRGRPRKER